MPYSYIMLETTVSHLDERLDVENALYRRVCKHERTLDLVDFTIFSETQH